MKNTVRYIIMSMVVLMGLTISNAFAGNKDRSGQAGAPELLINPWAASSGWANAGMSFVSGTEAIWGNVAGTSNINKFDINFTNTFWLAGLNSHINLISFGLMVKIGEANVIGFSFVNFSLGEIPITTVEHPEPGGLGVYKPSLMNINVSYARKFSNSISGGLVLKIINERISDMSCTGVAIDAGIQYVTGPTDNIHFGITLKNIGPTIKFNGDGLSIKAALAGNSNQLTVIQRADQFELPAQLNIGAAYDFNIGLEEDVKTYHRVTVAGEFTSNSFTNDQFIIGLEYGFEPYLKVRAGYTFEKGMFSKGGITNTDCMNINRGLSAGLSVDVPLTKKKENPVKLGIDYSFRDTYVFGGSHSIGLRILF